MGDVDGTIHSDPAAANSSDSIIYDTTEPATVVTGVDANWHSSPVTVTFTPADPNPALGAAPATPSGLLPIEEVKVDAGVWTPIALVAGSASVIIPANAVTHADDGLHTVSYRAIDNAGNVEHDVTPGTYKSVTVKIDTTKPTVSLSGTDALWHTGGAGNAWTLTFSGTDPNAPNSAGIDHYQYQVDGGGWNLVVSNPMTLNATAYANGTHEFDYRSVDAAVAANTGDASSWVFHVDKTAPVTSWDNPTTDYWNVPYAANFSAVDPNMPDASDVDHINLKVHIGGTWTAGSSISVPVDLVGHTDDGINHVWVSAVDKAYLVSNVETPHHYTVRVDTLAPVTTNNNDGAWHNTNYTVTLSPTDPTTYTTHVAGVDYTEWRVDGGSWNMGTAALIPAPVDHSNDGLRLLEYRSVDNAEPSGNVEAIKSTTVKIDTTAPVTTDDAPATWNSSDVTVTLTPTDVGGSGVLSTLYRVTNNLGAVGAWTPYAAPITVTAPGSHANDGIWTIEYKSTDNVGNVEAVKTALVKIDTRTPVTSQTGLDDGAWHSSAVTVDFTAADQSMPNASGVDYTEYRVDGGSWTHGTEVVIPAPANHSNDGKHTVDYRSVDNAVAPNVELVQSGEVWIDTTAPVTSTDHLSGFYADWHSVPVTVNLTAVDPNLPNAAGVYYTEYRVDGGGWTTGTVVLIPAPADGSNDGPHTIDFRSEDLAVPTGNLEAMQTVTVKIDTQTPTTTGADGWWNPTYPYTLTAVDQIGRSGVDFTEYRLDSGPAWLTYADPGFMLAGPQDAEHTIDYRSTDNAVPPNVEPYKTSHVTIDQTAPVTVVNGADSDWHPNPVSLSFAATDVGAGVDYTEYSLDGGTNWTHGNSVTISDNGITTVKYRSVDLAQPSGNVEATKSVDVKVDQIAPSTTDNAPTGWRSATVTVTLTPTDTGGSGLALTQYRVTNNLGAVGSWTTYAAPISITAPGSHANDGIWTIEYKSTDNAGNVEAVQSAEVKIDTTAPATTTNHAASFYTDWHNAPVSVTLSATDPNMPNAAGVDYIEYSLDGGGSWTHGNSVFVTDNGVTTITYRAVDLAQSVANVEGTHSVTVKVDQIDPATTDNYDGAWHTGDVTVTLSPTDTGGSGLDYTEYKIGAGSWTTGTSVLVTAAAHTGETVVSYRSADNAGNVEATNTITVKIDPGSPVTTISSVPLWNRSAVSMTISATAGPSGVAAIQYQLDGGAWAETNANSVLYTTPAVQGSHTVTARGVSGAAVTGASVSVTFNIDLAGPRTSAHKATGMAGTKIALKYRIKDTLSPQATNVTIKVRNSSGATVKVFKLGTKNVNTWYTKNWKPKHAGMFRYSVYAKDLAGNPQSHLGWAMLTVM